MAAQLACLLEVSAQKPGNVGPGRHFPDARYEDFLASAAAIGPPMGEAGARSLGRTVRLAVEATARWTRSNTNLGIVLLLAPLARAAGVDGGINRAGALRTTLGEVLQATTVEDAREVYSAIRLAAPGGLGTAEAQDISGEPEVTLVDAMRLAADRDLIAREYVTGFGITFGVGVPALVEARDAGLSWDDAVVETFLRLLSENPDTHIARRSGMALAEDISCRSGEVLRAGGVRSPEGRRAIEAMDRALRDPTHSGNPGTTADLTAAATFVVLLEYGWTSS